MSAASVVPADLPSEQLDYSEDRAPTDQAMAENDISKEQLAEGNEPEFNKTLESRSTAEKHEASVENRYRQSEKNVQNQAQANGEQSLAQGLTGMHDVRAMQIGQVNLQQLTTTNKDSAERQRITNQVNEIKNNTRTNVNSILTAMENEAANKFESGLKRAEQAYNDTFEEAKGRIGIWLTTWGDDWEELIENSLETARNEYLRQVDLAIDEAADIVEKKTGRGKKTRRRRAKSG